MALTSPTVTTGPVTAAVLKHSGGTGFTFLDNGQTWRTIVANLDAACTLIAPVRVHDGDPVTVAYAAAELADLDPGARPGERIAITPQHVIALGVPCTDAEVANVAAMVTERLTPEWAAGAIGGALRALGGGR